MKKITVITFLAILLAGCGGRGQQNNEEEQTHVTDVSVSAIYYGHIDKDIELSAVTAFLKKSVITAPNASFVTSCYVQPGTLVHNGQTLYRLASKEREALGSDIIGANIGVVNVKANASGIVTDVQQQSGGYVTEGSPLCYIANTNSLVFEIEVPTEDMKYAKAGTSCFIYLPDGRKTTAVLSTPLATMDVNTQVQLVPARAKVSFLPEGLRAKAILKTTSAGGKVQILPKSAIQSDDNMTSFWIMEVSNGNRAKKIPVTLGNSNNNEAEITAPHLSSSDNIITTGSYQLQDGDEVRIVKQCRK